MKKSTKYALIAAFYALREERCELATELQTEELALDPLSRAILRMRISEVETTLSAIENFLDENCDIW